MRSLSDGESFQSQHQDGVVVGITQTNPIHMSGACGVEDERKRDYQKIGDVERTRGVQFMTKSNATSDDIIISIT